SFSPATSVAWSPRGGKKKEDITAARRYVFCGTFRRTDLNPFSRTLSGTLLCGVRTFLSLRPKAQRATVRSSCLQVHYMRSELRGVACPRVQLPCERAACSLSGTNW